MAALRERLAGDHASAQSFATLVRRISAAIVTRDYKHDASEWETDDSADVPAGILLPPDGLPERQRRLQRRGRFEVEEVTGDGAAVVVAPRLTTSPPAALIANVATLVSENDGLGRAKVPVAVPGL